MTKDIADPARTPPQDLTLAELGRAGGGAMPGVYRVPDVTLKRGLIG